MKRCALLATLLAATPAIAGPCPDTFDDKPRNTLVERSRFAVEAGTHPITHLSIDNPLGDVIVQGYDGTALQIQTRKTAPDDDTLDRLRVSLVPNPDGTVSIKTTADKGESKPVARGAVRIDMIIHAPRDARVEAATSAGRLSVCNMDAGSDLDSAAGPIVVQNVQGEVLTHSVSGATQIGMVFGSVDAQTLASDLALDSIGGERLVASVHHGRIDGRRVRSRDIELTTTDGRIMLEAEAALRGRLVVSSLTGDVDVRLRRHGPVMVRARGTKVDLGTAFKTQPDGWAQTAFGTGENPTLVELRANEGTLKLVVVETSHP